MKTLLFSVTAKDLKFVATRGSGPGGQHRNKVATAIRCIHESSGAVGYACDERSQYRNKKTAFRRMAESKKFQDWIKIEAARVSGQQAEIEKQVQEQMQPHNIKCEVHDENGLWVLMGDD